MYPIDKRPVYKKNEKKHCFDSALYFYSKYIGDCPICISYHDEPYVIPCGHSFCLACLKRSSEFSSTCPICLEYYWAFKPARLFFLDEIQSEMTFKRLETRNVLDLQSEEFYDNPFACFYNEEIIDKQMSSLTISTIDASTEKSSKEITNTEGTLLNHKIKDKKTIAGFKCNARIVNRAAEKESSLKNASTRKDTLKNHVFYQSSDGKLCFLDPKCYKGMKSYPEYIHGTIEAEQHCYPDSHKYPELYHIPSNTKIVLVTILH
jgi:zinc finger of C3HC4-type, RING